MKQNFILNIWTSDVENNRPRFYPELTPIAELGDFKIYRDSYYTSFLYVYKDKFAISELAGLNKDHLQALATDTEPKTNVSKFLFQRAKEQIIKGAEMMKAFNLK